MKSVTKLSFIFILLAVACSRPAPKKSIAPNDITFSEYLKTLDTIPLPFSHACAGPNFAGLSTNFDSTGFKKYGDKNCARPLGILFNGKETIVLVDLSNTDFCSDPFLTSFDKAGHQLDALNLYGKTSEDTASSSMPFFKIGKDKSIMVIDTAKQWKRDTVYKMIPGSEIVKIDTTIYELSKKGKFIEVTRRN